MASFEINKVNGENGEVMGTMSIEVRAFPLAEPKGSTKGYASVTIDGLFAASGISIVGGEKGLFVAMPQTKDAKGKYRDLFHPITKEGRETLNKAVLAEFSTALDEMVVQKESTVQKMRDASAAAKEQTAQVAGKDAKNKNKSAPGL